MTGLALTLLLPAAAAAAPGPPPWAPSRPVCPGPIPAGAADCHSRVVTDQIGAPRGTTGPNGYSPAQFHGAYDLPSEAPSAQTIAIVDAYDDPTIEADLGVYSETYGLPECTTANGCFSKVNQEGTEGSYPRKDGGWALEISLDVEIAHAICQNCRILLVEASSNSFSNLKTAVNTAAALGADEISNSYGGGESSGQAGDTAYDHPGVAITASAGDGGYAAEYPAASPDVVAVGGTTLSLGPSNSYGGETAWSGSGSGCSAFQAARAWQLADGNWPLTGCGAKRGVADVAADADPASGASVYDSTVVPEGGGTGWFKVGGTSLSAPLIAAVYALAGGGEGEYPAAGLYAHEEDSPASLHDVTGGSNGSCGGTIMCEAAPGYDGPTGVGTPQGLVAFGAPASAGPQRWKLTVSKAAGSEPGILKVLPTGVTCPYRCASSTYSFTDGQEVTVDRYEPAAILHFAGWSGGAGSASGCTGAGSCSFTIEEDSSLEALFSGNARATLSLKKEGGGRASITSTPAGVYCFNTCGSASSDFYTAPAPEEVTLSWTLGAGTGSIEWSTGAGACTGSSSSNGSCQVTMDEAHELVATLE